MADATPADADAPVAPVKNRSKLIVIIVAAVVAAGAACGGVYFFTGNADAEPAAAADKQKARDKAPQAPAMYVKFDPPFVVNFEAKGMTRFLQVSVDLMTRDQATADMIRQHDPVIRNDLLMLFGSQTHETISTREGKEKLRNEALQVVAKVIAGEGGTGRNVEQLYFTSFVMQ